jgi:uncharacterized protein YheU (UPF0270 family)
MHIFVKRYYMRNDTEMGQCEVMHGQYIRRIERQLISEEDTLLWLSRGELKVK